MISMENLINHQVPLLYYQLSPYPSDEELQRDLLTRINWETYRQATHTGLMKEYATKRTQPMLNGHWTAHERKLHQTDTAHAKRSLNRSWNNSNRTDSTNA